MKPKKYVNLHAHTTFSVYDGLGYPDEHIDFAHENGLEAHAFTDHGNMNAVPYIVQHIKKMKSEGKDFKPIFGLEAYAIPSMDRWINIYEESKKSKKSKKSDSETSATNIEDEDWESLKDEINERRHLTLIAKNINGLHNLFEVVSNSYDRPNFYRYPRIDFDFLEQKREGIIATTSCLGGILATEYWKHNEEGDSKVESKMREVVERMLDIYGSNFYGELQWNSIPEQHILNKYVIKFAEEYGFQLISTADVHYPTPQSWKARELYKRIGKKWIKEREGAIPDSVDDIGFHLYPKNAEQMWEDYKKYSAIVGAEYDDSLILDSIERTHTIAFEEVEDYLPNTDVRLPAFIVSDDKTEDEQLREQAYAAFKVHPKREDEQYQERLEKELSVIAERGFSKYFLTMKAISDIARKNMMVGPARGSAGGSIVAYLLKITEVDPIKYDLLFERFLTKGNSGFPDIDYDLENRDRINEILIDKWGENTVVPISNWNTLQLKTLLKEIAKYHSVPFDEVNAVTTVIDDEAVGPAKQKHGITSGVYEPTYEEYKEFSSSFRNFILKYPEIEEHIHQLFGQIKAASRHAGGVVIADNLNREMPLVSNKDTKQVPWPEGQKVRHLEPMGFIKFDLLGLSTLEMIRRSIEKVLIRHEGVKNPTFEDVRHFYDQNLHCDVIDFNDPRVYENVFHDGKWAGIFQFTQKGAQKFCMRAKPLSIIDIATITSIYRPGPLGAHVDDEYVEAKEAPHKVQYINDIHREVTGETLGFCIFQEQIALLAHRLGKNLTLDEGNMLRKVLTKKGTGKGEEALNEIKDKFFDGALEKGMTKYQATKMWELFEYFNKYGFNKSHAVAYSMISYQCAWLLTYYPECWLAGYLQVESEDNNPEKIQKAISAVQQMGYKIQKPNVNYSSDVWEVSKDGDVFFQPLTDIKGLGKSTYAELIKYRPFESIDEFLFHGEMKKSKVKKNHIDVMCRAGALDDLIDNRFNGSKHFWSAIAVDRPNNEEHFQKNIESELYRSEGDFSDIEKIAFQYDLTSIYPLFDIVSEDMVDTLEAAGIMPLTEYDPDLQKVWLVPIDVKTKETRTGKKYWELLVIDSTFKNTKIKIWNVDVNRDRIQLNRLYILNQVVYDQKWGYSTGWKTPFYENFNLV